MVKTYCVVTGVVRNNKKVLILRKAHDDMNYPDRWSFCSGFVKEFEPAEESVLREIKEETGLDAKIVKTGNIITVLDKRQGKRWLIACYLCESKSNKVKLCHENVDFKWVTISESKKYRFVPGLTDVLDSLGLH